MVEIITDLKARGLVYQSTGEDQLASWLAEKPRSLYIGFDPTADSMHVGHMMALMNLRRFQQAGHRPIALVGGATGMIGDPSGKSEERNLLDETQLQVNSEAMKQQMSRFLDFDGGDESALLVNNLDWMRDYPTLDFLRDIGKNFPVNMMLAKESVKSRLEESDSGLSFTEFSYMLLQAYDFVHLHDQYGCELQVGGSDQWGNITAGIDLGRRMRSVQLYGLTSPLLTKADGSKMGKTESGAIWLSAERTSPYKFYQYWINVADDDAGGCLRTLTELPLEKIDELDRSRQEEPQKRESQRALAEHLTLLVHGSEGLSSATQASEILFGEEISDLDDAQLLDVFSDVPSLEVSADQLASGNLLMVDLLVETGLCQSKGEARRSIEQGGAYINNKRVEAMDRALTHADMASDSVIVVRRGKKKYALLKLTS
jgi:tyrosyl-tRNA synthetase|tara:strand:+ start:5337 stop:6623 length:1287 start_codon:yes stop_codon:yes gene_type:complete